MRFWALLLLVLALVAITPRAKAQPLQKKFVEAYCVNKDILEATLSEFEEVPLFRARSHRGEDVATSMVIFVSESKKTWTIVEKIAKGNYCIIGLGQAFEIVPQNIRDELEQSRKNNRP